jgi:hypothetical protein
MSFQPSDAGNAQAPPHQISCITCRQRKVKCDKQHRCSNCMKAGVECVYAVPARPRRRIGNGKSPEDVSREELIHRVKRYETLFRKHGLHLNAPDDLNGDSANSNSESHTATNVTLLHGQALHQSQDEGVKHGLASQSVKLLSI